MRIIAGIGVSPGLAIGPLFLYARGDLHVERREVQDTASEWMRFQAAVKVARAELALVHARAEAEAGSAHADIFAAQALMLEDPDFLASVRSRIEEQRLAAEAALTDAADKYARLLQSLDDEYLRSRAADLSDVTDRLLRALLGDRASPTAALAVPSIVLARNLTPSDTVLLDKRLVLGFCTAEGGLTSHTAILARALGLPAVVGVGEEALSVPVGVHGILDATEGRLLVEPDRGTLERYRVRQASMVAALDRARMRTQQPAVTADGHHVEVVANIGGIDGARAALLAGAEGVGLLRTEFLYLDRPSLPDEEEQYRAYVEILEALAGLPVTLRTLDVGGDKDLPYLAQPHGLNPFLGVRGIRLCLAHPHIFRSQLKAALRSGAGHNLRLMFPMVATVAEVRAARALLEDCRRELAAQGHPVADGMQVGIMVEVPAAALMADRLAAEVDFMSIGTNDLAQYTLAADRTNAQVAALASAFHPAVLRLVQMVIEAGHARGKRVAVCGELAGEPLAVPILLGLGLDEFSMNPPAIPVAKEIIRALHLPTAREIAHTALELDGAEAVQALVRRRVPVVCDD
ncbi:MAG: phosphoenolpyruvate--protein phosphotransferase [Anaerolineae bacterium]